MSMGHGLLFRSELIAQLLLAADALTPIKIVSMAQAVSGWRVTWCNCNG